MRKRGFTTNHAVHGFTLIELLVVIAIIGILATLMLMGYRTIRQRARDTQRKTNTRSFVTALELYFDNGNRQTFPSVDFPGAGSNVVADTTVVCPVDYDGGASNSIYELLDADEALNDLPAQPNTTNKSCVFTFDDEADVPDLNTFGMDIAEGTTIVDAAPDIAWDDMPAGLTTAAANEAAASLECPDISGNLCFVSHNAVVGLPDPRGAVAAIVGHDLENGAHFWARTAQ